MPNIKDTVVLKWTLDGYDFEENFNIYDEDEESLNFDDIGSNPSIYSYFDPDAFQNDESKATVVLALNDCMEKLAILKCISEKNVIPCPNNFIEYQTIEARFGASVDFGEEFYSEAKKRHQDQAIIFGILYKTLQELTGYGTFNSLLEGSRIINQHKIDEEHLFQDLAYVQQREIDKRLEIITLVKKLSNEYRAKCLKLHKTKELYEDMLGYSKQELRYSDDWESARENQRKLKLEKEENFYNDSVESSRIKMKLEDRIHSEIEKYFEENKKDMLEEIDYWTFEYDEQIEKRDQQLLTLKIEKDSQMEHFNFLQATYDEHNVFVQHWGTIREARRLAAELLERQIYAAIRIQAWWRGVMFRKKLGPYRKKKKGKGKGKDKKGKKK